MRPSNHTERDADLIDLERIGAQLADVSVEGFYTVDGSHIRLPDGAHRLLAEILRVLGRHDAETWLGRKALTTQEAADLLGVSRPTLVKLLEQGKIPFHKVNTYRRMHLADVLRYREEMTVRRRAVAEAEHSGEMEGQSLPAAALTDADDYVSGQIDEHELVSRARARHGLD